MDWPSAVEEEMSIQATLCHHETVACWRLRHASKILLWLGHSAQALSRRYGLLLGLDVLLLIVLLALLHTHINCRSTDQSLHRRWNGMCYKRGTANWAAVAIEVTPQINSPFFTFHQAHHQISMTHALTKQLFPSRTPAGP
jgi:hypothetical protein